LGDALVATWKLLALAALVKVAAVLGHPCLVHWKILVVAFVVEVRCRSSRVPYSHPCQPNLVLRFRVEHLACPQVADEFDQRLVDPVARVGQVLLPSAVGVGTVTLDAVFEGRHSDPIQDYLYRRDEN